MGAGVLLALIGVAITGASFWVKGRARRRFLSWPAVPGVVTEQEHTSGTLTTAETTLQIARYSYEVNGAEHGGKIQMTLGKTMGENVRQQALLDEYPVGKSLEVHYDPADPSKSLIEAGSEGGTLLTLLGVALAVVGLVSILTHR